MKRLEYISALRAYALLVHVLRDGGPTCCMACHAQYGEALDALAQLVWFGCAPDHWRPASTK